MLQFSTIAFFAKTVQAQTKIFILPQCVPTFASASNSVILSLASFITSKYPNLIHPLYQGQKIEQLQMQQHKSQDFPCSDLSLHPLYESWCDLLCQAIYDGNAYRENNTLYLVIETSQDYLKQLQNLKWIQRQLVGPIKLSRIFKLQQVQQQDQIKKPNILLLNFATSQLRQNQLLPKIHLPALILGTIFDNENWSFFCVLKGEYPNRAQLLQADSIILPGSSNSVLDKIQPVDEFMKQFTLAFEQNKKLKVLSICYGHQLISKLFKSTVVRKNRFEGHEKVIFDMEKIKKYKFLSHIVQKNEKQWLLSEHHEDYVQKVPDGFDLIATSNSCYVQAMVKQDARILSLQFHPQYMSQYTIAFTNRAQKANAHFHAGFALNVPADQLERHHQSCHLIRLCIKQFLNAKTNC